MYKMVDAKDNKTMTDGMPSECGHCHKHRKIGRFLVCLLIVLVAVWIWNSQFSYNFPAVSGSVWQAVFLDNNQVYFGHLKNYNDGYVVLKNIFYLRTAEPLQQNAQGPNLNLVKLGGELHGPQDEMYIPKGKIVFWENLKNDSQVSQAIGNFLASQKK